MWHESHSVFRCSFEQDAAARDVGSVLICEVTNYGLTRILSRDTGCKQCSRFVVKAMRIDHLRPVEYHQASCKAHESNPDLVDVFNWRITLPHDLSGFVCTFGAILGGLLVQRRVVVGNGDRSPIR